MTFEEAAVLQAVNKLIKGEDHRTAVIDYIDSLFLEFTTDFYKNIVAAKLNNQSIDLSWYKDYFLDGRFSTDESAPLGSIGKKTITNIYGGANKQIVLSIAKERIDFLSELIEQVENDITDKISILVESEGNSIQLNYKESQIIINVLATKKNSIRGGAWSAIGKRVEKPLLDKLCELSGVPSNNIDNSNFVFDSNLQVDREVDYKLISRTGSIYRCEVKLMGKGNPESADATIARDSDVFIADTLSTQNKAQLTARGVKWLELKDNNNAINDFITNILEPLNIPHD